MPVKQPTLLFIVGPPAVGKMTVGTEIAASDLPGAIFTYVWAFDDPRDEAGVEELATIFRSRQGRVLFAELEATQEERLRRNETEFRLHAKPFKRDLEKSRAQLLANDAQYQLNSHGRFSHRSDYLCIDNTDVPPDTVAERIIDHFALSRIQASQHRE